jgi:hypothetical protein
MVRGVYSEQDETLTSGPAGPGSLAADVRRLLNDARALLHDQLHLLALEAERAGRALALMTTLGVASGILLAGTGLGLGAALALWLLEQGLRPSAALLAASLLDLVGVLMLWAAMQRTSAALTFPATRKSLRSSNPTDTQRADTQPSDTQRSDSSTPDSEKTPP